MRKTLVLAALLGLAAPALAAPLAPVTKVFDKIAAAKNDRVFHATGKAYRATFTGTDGVARDSIVRVSRGGVTKDLSRPDIMGIALKVQEKNGPQDYLMIASKGERGLKSRVPLIVDSAAGKPISTVTNWESNGTKGPITAQLPTDFHTTMDSAPPAVMKGDRSFTMSIQGGGVIRPRTTAKIGDVTVHFDEPLSAEESKGLSFKLTNNSDSVKPVGLVNTIRKAAMIGSREGRGLPN